MVVDGNDVAAVFQAAEKAVKRARAGEGPTLVECKTYRWRGHHEGDPNQGARYRTREEIDVWKKKCPIERFARHLVGNRTVAAGKLESIDREIAGRIDAAVAYAEASEFPAYEEMFEDVYV
jgi:TPP-dependent pyruvate/acetoin dehydrogenase alpha subunit